MHVVQYVESAVGVCIGVVEFEDIVCAVKKPMDEGIEMGVWHSNDERCFTGYVIQLRNY